MTSFGDRVRIAGNGGVTVEATVSHNEIDAEVFPLPGNDGDSDMTLAEMDDDKTAKMLVIPIIQEIPADFRLVGCQDIIQRCEYVLTQRGKQRNPILYGETGIGKTAILHGLVQQSTAGDLSTHMYKRTWYRLNTSVLLHMNPEMIDSEFDRVVQELNRYDVLVIEGFYTLLTHLRPKNTNVMVSFLDALYHRKFQAIVTCSKREYTMILNEVPESHEFFAPAEAVEPNDDQLLNILRGVRGSYERRYGVSILNSALVEDRNLTQKHRKGLEGWVQPGRALILLDRAIAQFSVKMNSRRPELVAMETEIATATDEIESLVESPTVKEQERCVELRARIAELEPKVAVLRQEWIETTAPIQAIQTDKMQWEKTLHDALIELPQLEALRANSTAIIEQNTSISQVNDDLNRKMKTIGIARRNIKRCDNELAAINLSQIRDHIIKPEHILATYSDVSDIPMTQLTADERDRIKRMEEILGEQVYGQPDAIKRIATAVRRERAELTDDETGPKGKFLLLGPSGVGKTETAKALATFLTADVKNMIRIDMSEYMSESAETRLTGAAPGLVGYDEGGVLTNAVHDRPKAVIVFDEAEKAHKKIFNPLLQVLSDGRLTDGRGELVDFRETYCIFTSNLGGEYFINDAMTFEEAEAAARKAVEGFFTPEFLGRLDGIICYHRLETPMLIRVAQRRVNQINTSIGRKNLALNWPIADVERFCEAVKDARYGARPILREMKARLESILAEAILDRVGDTGGTFHATFTTDTIDLNFEPNHVESTK